MAESEASIPAWRQAENYRPLLGADVSVWAWEFLRRAGPQTAPGGLGVAGRPAPELCFAGPGPRGDPLPAALWRWQADPAVPVLSLEPAAARERDALDLPRLPVASLVVRTGDGAQHVLIADGAARLRFAVVQGDVLAGPAACRFHLPAHSVGAGSLDSLRLLIALRDTGRLPATAHRPPAKAARWLQILQVHDGRRAGASHREIAQALFGADRVQTDWNGRSDYMRMRVQRLVRAAEAVVRGGYRSLCGLRPPASARPDVVEIWRSAAWRGGVLPMVFGTLIFLGTSVGASKGPHVACRPCVHVMLESGTGLQDFGDRRARA